MRAGNYDTFDYIPTRCRQGLAFKNCQVNEPPKGDSATPRSLTRTSLTSANSVDHAADLRISTSGFLSGSTWTIGAPSFPKGVRP